MSLLCSVDGCALQPPADFVSIIRDGPCIELTFANCRTSQRAHEDHFTTPSAPIDLIEAMSGPCRNVIGASRAFESSAVPRLARRTFASQTSTSTPSSRVLLGTKLQCLREAQRANSSLKCANSLREQTRSFTQSTSRSKLKTIDQIKARNKGGVRTRCCIRSLIKASLLSSGLYACADNN